MISIGTIPFQTQSSNCSHGSCAMKLFCSNRSNSTQTYPIDLAKNEENKIVQLEKSLDFLRSQHDAMLKSLHDEIEHLRKTNKALQFRLVMCCCTNARGERGSVLRNSSTQPTGECTREVNELKALLEEERIKNSLLSKQIEALRLTGLRISDTTQLISKEAEHPKPESERKSERKEKKEPAPNDNVQSPIHEQRSSLIRRSVHSKDKLIEPAEHGNPERPSVTNRLKQRPSNRIVSPELNADSSSSAILLSPNTMIDTPDGFWVRPSIASLQNRASIMTNSPRMSRGQGSQIMAVKLPVLRASGSYSHITVKDTTKDVPSSTMPQSNETPAAEPDEEPGSRRHSNQSNDSRHNRSPRSVKIMVNTYEATTRVSVPRSTRSTMCYPGRTRNNANVEPFLPTLPKSAEPRHFIRNKKPSDSLRKNHYDASPSAYHPP